MEVAFEILIPKRYKLENLNFQFELFEWGGVKYEQGFEKMKFDNHFELAKTPMARYLELLLEQENLGNEWYCLAITGDGITKYREELTEQLPLSIEPNLSRLLKEVLSFVTPWVIVFEVEHGKVDRRVNGNLKDIIDQIKLSLLEDDNGFIMFNYG